MSKRKRAKSTAGAGLSDPPKSLAEAGAYMSALADRSEEISGRLRGAADFVVQLGDVEAGVRSGARRVFRLRTLVLLVLIVGTVIVLRSLIQSKQVEPAATEPVRDAGANAEPSGFETGSEEHDG